MSVVKQVAKLAVSPAQQEALDRLQAAETHLTEAAGAGGSQHRVAKLEALTDLDRYDTVLRFAEPDMYEGEVACYAYALYRTGQVAKLRAAVEKYSGSLAAQLALSQAEFKLGNLAAARELLAQASSKIAVEDEGDLLVNLSAVDALAGVLPRHASQTFDEFFNLACALLTKGQPQEALQALHEASAATDEEDDRHAAVVQAAYAHHRAGNPGEALQLLSSIDADADAVKIVAANNLLAAELPSDASLEAVHVALKQFDVVTVPERFLQLNANQRQVVARNRLRLLARAGISVSARAKKHRQQFPADLEPSVLAYAQTKTPKQLRKLARSGDAVAQLTLAARGEDAGAFPPALAYDRAHRLHKAPAAELESGNLDQLALGALVAGHDAEKGAAYFRSLADPLLREAGLSINGSSPGLINNVDSIDALVRDLDAEALDSAEAPLTALGYHAKRAAAVVNKKRSGKRKLPADFDAARAPNPERWLAKQDRSDYKPKKKKATHATQGAAVTGTAETSKDAAPRTQPTSAPASAAANKAKKKKSKGKSRK